MRIADQVNSRPAGSATATRAVRAAASDALREIETLPEAERRAIALYYFERNTLAATASAIGVSRTAAARLLASGLRKLGPLRKPEDLADGCRRMLAVLDL